MPGYKTNYEKARDKALALNATTVGHSYTTTRHINPSKEIFTSHFFDENGLEVGYYHHYLGGLSSEPLNVMEPKRPWDEGLKSRLVFEDLPKLN